MLKRATAGAESQSSLTAIEASVVRNVRSGHERTLGVRTTMSAGG
jgi:hypothetical protein